MRCIYHIYISHLDVESDGGAGLDGVAQRQHRQQRALATAYNTCTHVHHHYNHEPHTNSRHTYIIPLSQDTNIHTHQSQLIQDTHTECHHISSPQNHFLVKMCTLRCTCSRAPRAPPRASCCRTPPTAAATPGPS